MSVFLGLALSTTVVLSIAAIVAEFFLSAQRGRQDATWRYALLISAALPVLFVMRPFVPKQELSIASIPRAATVQVHAVSDQLVQAEHESNNEQELFRTQNSLAMEDHTQRSQLLDSSVIVSAETTAPPMLAARSASSAAVDPSSVASSAGSNHWSAVMQLMLLLWMAISLFLLLHLAEGWRRLSQILSTAKSLGAIESVSKSLRSAELVEWAAHTASELKMPMGSTRVLVSSQIGSPIVAGILRPAIVLPSVFLDRQCGLGEGEIRQILTHEMMHVRRNDPVWNLLLQIVFSIWWPHPLVHLMRHRMAALRELLCDGEAAGTSEPETYADTLLRLASQSRQQRGVLPALAIQPPESTLESRVRWVLSRPSHAQRTSYSRRARILFASLILVSFACFVLIEPVVTTTAQDIPVQDVAVQDIPVTPPERDTAVLAKPKPSAAANAEKATFVSGPSVSGTVHAPDGSVVANAKVYLRSSPSGSITLPTHPLETTSDETGRFGWPEVIKPGPYRLWAETDSFTSLNKKLGGLSIRVQAETPNDAPKLEIKLHEGCGYDVTIVSAATDKPISSARVSFGWTDIEREYVSGDDGVAKIRNLGADDWYFIIRAAGYATELKKTSEQNLGAVLPLRFELSAGGALVGTLRDESGKPIADATVSVVQADVSMSPSYGKVQTDALGNYSFTDLPIGKPLRLSAGKDGYDHGSLSCAVIDSQSPTRADLVCKKQPYGGDVVVTVIAADGSPIAGAALLNRGNNSSWTREATTDGKGIAKLQDLYSGYAGCYVTVKAEGFISQQLQVVPGTIEQPADLKVQLARGRTVRGIIVRPDGTPAEKLRVFYNGAEQLNDLGGMVTSDQEGRFELHGLPDDSKITVYTPQEFAPIRQLPIPVKIETEFRIQMTIAGLLRVRALDAETKQPIKEFNVKLGFCEIQKTGDPPTGSISSSLINPGINVQGTKTEYRLEGQAVGAAYKLIVSAAGYEPKTIARAEAHAADRSELLDVSLDRMRAENYQRVAGRLVDADGKAIVGAQVRLLLGSDVPHRIDPFTQQRSENGWRFYHWDLLSRDDIENRDKCVQLLKTVSDSEGGFVFTGVKKDTPWMELFYFGESLLPQRYNNLRSRDPQELQQLKLQAERPSTIAVTVDFRKHPAAHSVSLRAQDYVDGPNAVKLAYGSRSEELPIDGSAVLFQNLPAGEYEVTISEKPVQMAGGNSYRVKGIASKPIRFDEGSDSKVSF